MDDMTVVCHGHTKTKNKIIFINEFCFDNNRITRIVRLMITLFTNGRVAHEFLLQEINSMFLDLGITTETEIKILSSRDRFAVIVTFSSEEMVVIKLKGGKYITTTFHEKISDIVEHAMKKLHDEFYCGGSPYVF